MEQSAEFIEITGPMDDEYLTCQFNEMGYLTEEQLLEFTNVDIASLRRWLTPRIVRFGNRRLYPKVHIVEHLQITHTEQNAEFMKRREELTKLKKEADLI